MTLSINQRHAKQHDRVQNGLNSGQMTPAERRALRLETKANVALERAENGGAPLSDAQKREVLNERSADIWNLKHNNITA